MTSLLKDVVTCNPRSFATQTSMADLFDQGTQLNPTVYPRRWEKDKVKAFDEKADKKPGEGPSCECCNTGYMHGFMDMINSTWPGAKHVFLNLGWCEPASGMLANCLCLL